MSISLAPGLYIVATPIGNLSDLTARAADTLRGAALILAEDKRVTAKLLAHVGATAPMNVYHDHSSEAERDRILARLGGEAVALVSDAGTPLISDPGYKLVRAARAAGHLVHTVPGPCAAIAALTLAGLPTDRFLFAGFLPAKAKARADAIAELAMLRASLVFYESGPRLHESLLALAAGLGNRDSAVIREITKLHEETVTGPASLQLDGKEFEAAWRAAGSTHLISLAVAGGAATRVLIRDVQYNLLKRRIDHVDFYAADLLQETTAAVRLVLGGSAPIVERDEGMVMLVQQAVQVRALPTQIPNQITVDISGIETSSDDVRVADLPLPPGVTIMDAPETVVVAVTRDATDEIATRARTIGCAAVLPVTTTADELVEALEAAAGKPRATEARPQPQRVLTHRETQIVELVARGLSNSEIAHELFLSVNSVKTYIRTAYRKMGVTTRSQAVLWAVRGGLASERAHQDPDEAPGISGSRT